MTTKAKILLARTNGTCVLKFAGEVRLALAPTLTPFVNSIGQSTECETIIIDLRDVDCIDSTMLGMLAKISLRSQEALDKVPTIISTRDDVTRILLSMGFDSIFAIAGECESANEGGELAPQVCSEDEMRTQVIEAHRILMSLNESNREEFSDLVKSLEGEQQDGRPPIRAVN